jgi:hypothetical protein
VHATEKCENMAKKKKPVGTSTWGTFSHCLKLFFSVYLVCEFCFLDSKKKSHITACIGVSLGADEVESLFLIKDLEFF